MSSPYSFPAPNIDSFSKPFFFFSNNQASEITFLSPSVEDVLGFRPKDLLGRCYTELIDVQCPLNRNVEECRRQRFDANGDHSRMDLRVVYDNNGNRRVLSTQTYGETDENGRVIFNHGIAQDITNTFMLDDELRNRFILLRERDEKLSQRERDVLNRVLNGRLNKSIARELDVSERTVESARARLMDKYCAETTAHLVRLATEYQMLNRMVELSRKMAGGVDGPHGLRPNLKPMGTWSSNTLQSPNEA